jgi:hypothetical protein
LIINFKLIIYLFFNLNKLYNINIVDYIVSSAASIFEIDIYILNTHTSKKQERKITSINFLQANQKYSTNVIILERELFEDAENQKCFHYNLILDSKSNKPLFDYFSGSDQSLSSESSDLSDESNESEEEKEMSIKIFNLINSIKMCCNL